MVEFNRALAEERRLPFAVLFDEGNQVAAQFGLVFRYPDYLIQTYQNMGTLLPQYNGDDSWTLPIPARFIINTSGIITWSEANADYTIRPEPEATLALVQQLIKRNE